MLRLAGNCVTLTMYREVCLHVIIKSYKSLLRLCRSFILKLVRSLTSPIHSLTKMLGIMLKQGNYRRLTGISSEVESLVCLTIALFSLMDYGPMENCHKRN